jgi:hypothetical protein
MDKAQIDKMEKWTVVMNLMGFDRDDLHPDAEDFDSIDEFNLFETVENLVKWQARMENPDRKLLGAMRTLEMNVSTEEVYEYHDYLDELETTAERERIRLLESTNVEIKRILEDFQFKMVDSKHLPKHCHYEFVMPNGIAVKGRTFRPKWGRVRTWLSWRDSKNKLQRQCWDGSHTEFVVPGAFPAAWKEWYNYTTDFERMAMITTWWMGMGKHKHHRFAAIKK